MTRKNMVIDRTFSNRFLRGATDRVALQYRSSRGFSTIEDVKREVASFSNAENFFYVQFRKTWYPVYLLAGAATIVVGKSFFCYGSSAEHKQPYLTYVEKKPAMSRRSRTGSSAVSRASTRRFAAIPSVLRSCPICARWMETLTFRSCAGLESRRLPPARPRTPSFPHSVMRCSIRCSHRFRWTPSTAILSAGLRRMTFGKAAAKRIIR